MCFLEFCLVFSKKSNVYFFVFFLKEHFKTWIFDETLSQALECLLVNNRLKRPFWCSFINNFFMAKSYALKIDHKFNRS